MTYYEAQILKLNNELYSKDYITKQVIGAKHFIDHNFSNNIKLEEIAGEAFFSTFHFIRLFKKYYGRTPYQYLTGIRIAKAKELLQSGLTVSATCYFLGFESLSSFSGLFKKTAGLTPIAYQRKKAILKK